MFNLISNNKKTIILILVLLILLLLLVLVFIRNANTPDSLTSSQISKYLKTEILTTNEAELNSRGDIKQKIALQDNKTEYYIESNYTLRDDLIVTDKGKVVFERAITVEKNAVHPRLNEYVKKYGEAEAKKEGSEFYGKFETTYIYASKGFALVANPFTEEIDEIHRFAPMSVEEYLLSWGKDIKEQSTIENLGH